MNKLFSSHFSFQKIVAVKTLLFFCFFYFNTSTILAQDFAWAKSMGSPANDLGRAVTVDAAGNVYTVGFFTFTADFDPSANTFNLTSAGGQDIFVSKLDNAGNLVWAKRMGGTASEGINGIVLDTSGNIYVSGYFNGTADFDPSANTYNLTSVGGQDIFVSKLDNTGNLIWAKSMGGTSVGAAADNSLGIALDALENIYFTGYFNGIADFDPSANTFNLTSVGGQDIFVSKLDNAGNLIWAKSMGSPGGESPYSIAVDTDGNVYTAGYFLSTIDFDPGINTYNLTSVGSQDMFISKLDAAGNFVWAKSMGGSSIDPANGITVDATGNVYTTGYFFGTVDFDPDAGISNLTSAGSRDVFISKLDASGNFVWAKSMGGTTGDIGYGIAVDAVGDVYVTGYFTGTADFDPNTSTYNLSAQGNFDIFISKLDASGNFVWVKSMGGSGDDAGLGIAIAPSGDVHSTGYFNGTATFDPITGTNLTSNGGQDIFISKLSNPICGTPVAYNVISNSTYCAGTSGAAVGLNDTQTGVSYQLKNGANDVGAAVDGTGSGIFLGYQTAGTYTVVATRTSGGCTATMTGSAVITSTICCPSGTTLYVNASVSGGTGDGTTWANAYASLSDALAKAHTCSNITSIKVAAGTYKPTKKPFDAGVEISTSQARDVVFHIPDGVTIEGGYNAATGSRDITTNVTVLSGDIDNNNILDNGNAFHVVLASAESSTGVGVKIDGFSITGGYSDFSGPNFINGNPIFAELGCGIYVKYGTNTISNNKIYDNTAASNYGSGAAIAAEYSTNTISNNTINNNTATYAGGGIYTYYATNTISNNNIYENTSSYSGGGIYVYYSTNTINNNTLHDNVANYGAGIYVNAGANNIISNNTLYSNTGTYAGAGMYVNYSTNNIISNNTLFDNQTNDYGAGAYIFNSSSKISNNTFYQNTSNNGGSGVYTYNGTNALNNNIFYTNKIGSDDAMAGADYYAGGTVDNTCKNNLFQLASSEYSDMNFNDLGTGSSGNIFAQNPQFVSLSNIVGFDGIYRTADDGLALQSGSPCINAGITGVGIPTTDITGATRVGNPDMGAYEVLCTPPTVSAGAPITVNCTTPSTTLMATSSSPGAGGFVWDNGATQGGTVTPSTTTTYTVTVTGADGCKATASRTVTVDKTAPIANAGNDVTLTCASPSTTLVATGGVAYVWNNGATQGGTVTPVTTTTYTVTVTGANGCTATDDVVANQVNVCLSAVLSGTQTIISKDPANLVVTVTGGTSPYTIVYNNGVSDVTVNNYVSGTNIVVTPSLSTTYTLVSLKDAVNTNGAVSGSAIVTTLADNTPPTITSTDDIIDACAVPNPLPTSSKPTIVDNAQTPATLTLVSTVNGTLTSALIALKYTKYFIRTWKATDNNGNTATKTQNVYLRDNVAPIVTCKNPSITVGTADVTITPAMLLNSATDNCVASPTVAVAKGMVTTGAFTSNVKYTASTIPIGISTIQATLKVSDGLNVAYCTATVTLTKATMLANNNSNNNTPINQETTSDSNIEPTAQATVKQVVSMKCFPNPFSEDLNLQYNLVQDAQSVTLKVYDNQGRLMTTHETNAQRAGAYEMIWNLSDLSSGMYHICLEIDGKCMKMERVIMMK